MSTFVSASCTTLYTDVSVVAPWTSRDADTLAAFKVVTMEGATDAEFFAMLAFLQPDESLTLGTDRSQVEAGFWGRIPRTYIRHSWDRMIPVELQDRMIAEADRLTPDNPFDVHTIDAPHSSNEQQFAQVVGILDRLA